MSQMPNELAKRIKRKLVKEVKNIFRGFEVVWEEMDGCDSDGPMYWVECRNGFSGRSWDVTPRLINKLDEYLKSVASQGIEYNKIQYLLEPDIYFVRFEKFGEFTKPNFKIKIITEEEHTALSPLLKYAPIIYERIESNMKLLEQEEKRKNNKHVEAHSYEYRYSRGPLDILRDIEKGFKYCLTNNEELFEISFKRVLQKNNCKDIDYIFSKYVTPFIRNGDGM